MASSEGFVKLPMTRKNTIVKKTLALLRILFLFFLFFNFTTFYVFILSQGLGKCKTSLFDLGEFKRN